MAKKSKPWCYIPVSPRLKAKIDSEDLEHACRYRWRAITSRSGRKKVVTSIREGKKVRQVTLGRFLMKPPKNKQVYPRRFLDGLDYRKSNLVICSWKELQRQLPKRRKSSTSEFRGVSLISKSGKWRAGIEVEGRYIHMGDFESEIKAAQAYNRGAKKYFGAHAYQNQVVRRSTNRRRD